MNPVLIIEALTAAAKAAKDLFDAIEQGREVINEQDAQAIHEKLLEAEAATAILRPKVDAALQAASQR